MATLARWIEHGLDREEYRKAAMIERWNREARERRPVIDRFNYPDYPNTRKFPRHG